MKTVVIIGAGPAGISAAHELLKQSKEYFVVILEETEEIGGISRTVNYHGNRMDIGGHRFFSKEKRVNNWWNSILPAQGAPAWDERMTGKYRKYGADGVDPEKEDKVFLTRERVSRIYYNNRFFDYPVKMNLATIKNMGFLTTLHAGFSYLAAVFHKRPESSLENFYINRFGKKLYTMFFKGYTKKVWGRFPSEISADWGSQRVKGLSIGTALKNLFIKGGEKETSLIEEFKYPKLGPGQLWETAAEQVKQMGGEIWLGCQVMGVSVKDGRIDAVEYLEKGETKRLECDVLFSSMPLKDLIAGMRVVPEKIRAIAKGLPYRDFVTAGVLLKELKLKNTTKKKTVHDRVPDCWIYVQDNRVRMGRIQIFNNWSPYLLKDPENQVWIGLEYFCEEGDEDWNKTEEMWKMKAAEELKCMKLIKDSAEILDFHIEKVKKAYPAYFGTYDRIGELTEWLDRIENLFCIGRNGQHRYNNMDHSMMTAFRAVDLLLTNEVNKESVWNVNTEKIYHETSRE